MKEREKNSSSKAKIDVPSLEHRNNNVPNFQSVFDSLESTSYRRITAATASNSLYRLSEEIVSGSSFKNPLN